MFEIEVDKWHELRPVFKVTFVILTLIKTFVNTLATLAGLELLLRIMGWK